MRVLVTGANGFIGRHVVATLVARGHEVRAIVRPGSQPAPGQASDRVEVVRADLAAASCDQRVFDRVDSVVHLAAALRGSASEQRATTVDTTRRLLETMGRTPTRRLVLASSFAVYDADAAGQALDESSPLLPASGLSTYGPYAAAKWEQESVARQISSREAWDLIVLRPGFVWGRGRELPACAGWGLGPTFFVVGPRSCHCLCYVENCADLFALAATDPRATGGTFNVVDDDAPSSWRHAGNCFRLGSQFRFRVPVPYRVAAGGVRLARGLLGPLAPRLGGALVPTRFRARFRAVGASARAAREALGWRPPWSYAEALARAFGVEPCAGGVSGGPQSRGSI